VELLEEMDLEAHLAHPAACKTIAFARLKNDRVDARTLAQLLRADLLPEAWIAPRPVRELRLLLRHRAALVRLRTTLKSRIRAVLADRGIATPAALWERPGRAWLSALQLPDTERGVVEDLCGLLDAIEGEIRARAKPDARVEALQRLPGVGLLTAMTLVAEIGDISRFSSARKLCAWAGLTPRVRNSDTTVHHDHITKAGSAPVRWVLGEAAQIAKRHPPFEATYESIRKRRGNAIATVAIVRRLLAQSFHILKTAVPIGGHLASSLPNLDLASSLPDQSRSLTLILQTGAPRRLEELEVAQNGGIRP
jgi:transposase